MGARNVVRQMDLLGCGPACGEMLLRDRGYSVDQAQISDGLPLPADAPQLADRLSAISERRWKGGALVLPFEPDWSLLVGIAEARGSWAALLEPRGPAQIGHWVVVDGATHEGVVLVRDPFWGAYGIPLVEFQLLWRYTVVVIEEAPR